MEREYTYLIHLLDAFINGTSPEEKKDINWGLLTELATVHSVGGILGYMAMKYPICTPSMKEKMRQICLGTISRYNVRNAYMDKLSSMLDAEKIDHILFKGYVLKDYYPVPELRSYGDIDFVVRWEDKDEIHQLMLEQGFQPKVDWGPVLSYYNDKEFYEIHTDIMEINVSDKADSQAYFQNMWEHTLHKEGHTWEFTPEYHFIYLLTHIAKHIRGAGAGIRMYMDIAVFIRHFGQSIDWASVTEELKKLELYDFGCVVLAAVKEWFHVEPPIEIVFPKEEVMHDFMIYTMEAGVFGKINREQGLNVLRQKVREEKVPGRISVLLKRLFPSADTIESRYTYLQGRHWLLPAAWIHRLIKTRGSWDSHVKEAQTIMSAEEDEVLKINKLHRDIGL